MKKVESILLFLLIAIIWSMYPILGTVSAQSKINYSSYLSLPVDFGCPFIPLMIIPYLLMFLVIPGIYLILHKKDHHKNIEIGIFFCLCANLFLSYIIFYLLPTNTSEFFFDIPKTIYQDGIFNNIIRETYQNITSWNSFPSLHISASWIILRFAFKYMSNKTLKILLGLWFILMAFSTVSLRYHMTADVISGLVMGELVFLFWEYKQKYLITHYQKIKSNKRVFILSIFCVLASTVLVSSINNMSHLSSYLAKS